MNEHKKEYFSSEFGHMKNLYNSYNVPKQKYIFKEISSKGNQRKYAPHIASPEFHTQLYFNMSYSKINNIRCYEFWGDHSQEHTVSNNDGMRQNHLLALSVNVISNQSTIKARSFPLIPQLLDRFLKVLEVRGR